jgi:hypothetical protein
MELLDLPNEILLEILARAENDKNLSLVCKRFYDIVTMLNDDNVSLDIRTYNLVSFFKRTNEIFILKITFYFSLI